MRTTIPISNNRNLQSHGLFFGFLLLGACESLILLPAFGTFPGVVSAFVMSHKRNRRLLLKRKQKQARTL